VRRPLVAASLTVAGLLCALTPLAGASANRVGPVTSLSVRANTAEIGAWPGRFRVIFYREDVFRIWLAPDGAFTDPANTPPSDPSAPHANIVVKGDYPGVTPRLDDAGVYYRLATAALALRVYKVPLRFALYHADDRQRIWEETVPLTWGGGRSTQVLSRRTDEQFFGGGMQNGRFSHRGQTIAVSASFDWNEGGNPNSAPFFLSTAGYGVYRNTFAPGSYTFTDPVRASHEEDRFDAYYFVGDLKRVIDRYTELTGRPFMPPIYGLELGDSDCYRHHQEWGERHTRDALAVADDYVARRIPLGWMLVNDGYGCGYEDLRLVARRLDERNFKLGLWTSTGLADQDQDVLRGASIRKLDVGWVGDGYRLALSACEDSYRGIESHSAARGFVWLPEGWSGSQRCGVHWSGDQSGSWASIPWQIPTYAGATMSGMAYTTSDVDGIFGGSPATYVRDLEWKSFLGVVMVVNGWPRFKQPWRDGEPYTSITTTYLQLRERLLPYLYTYAARAHRDGLGPVRPLALDYPRDPNTWGNAALHEFLVGDAFLVAPVYRDATRRDGIYLPAGTWIDYWTGERHQGPTTIDGYRAPLERLPLFVKAGSIIPMWPEGTLSWRTRHQGQIDLDIYGEGTFTLYEDDGVTRGYSRGEYAEQAFTATTSGILIGPSIGSYTGQVTSRRYLLTLHRDTIPDELRAGDSPLHRYLTRAELDAAPSGWYQDVGVTHVKTAPLDAGQSLTITPR
jgi:alpha-glucosidase